MQSADAERRLPLSRMTAWEVFPFEQTGLRVVSLASPVLPEPARLEALLPPRVRVNARPPSRGE